jgi:hypothetical protein
VNLRTLKPRLWYWTARYPEWTPDDGGEDAGSGGRLLRLLLARPQDARPLRSARPDDDEDVFWEALDDDVQHHGRPMW